MLIPEKPHIAHNTMIFSLPDTADAETVPPVISKKPLIADVKSILLKENLEIRSQIIPDTTLKKIINEHILIILVVLYVTD